MLPVSGPSSICNFIAATPGLLTQSRRQASGLFRKAVLGIHPSHFSLCGPLVAGFRAGVLAATDSSDLGRGLLLLPSRSAQESAWAERLDFLPTLVGWRQHLLRARARLPIPLACVSGSTLPNPKECASRFSRQENRRDEGFLAVKIEASVPRVRDPAHAVAARLTDPRSP